MNENLELTAKVSNLLTIEENSMAVNNTYEEQLEVGWRRMRSSFCLFRSCFY